MMKIAQSLRDIHTDAREKYDCLSKHVERTLDTLKDQRWHYEGRVKDLESFALKVETGNYDNPALIEDFFACTLVVENLGSMAKAESLIRSRFTFHERRPPRNDFTTKPSDCFRFDDTRLYVRWKDDLILPPTGLEGTLFEVQIKTFLAHAWAIATHDLTYKTDEKSWSKERIVFQVKAMLEHAEVSIQEAEKLAKSTSLKKTDEVSTRISATIKLIEDLWQEEALPHDRKRLAENIDMLIGNIDTDLDTLRQVLLKETELGRGTQTLNLSPYATVVQSLLNQELPKMQIYLTKGDHEFKVYIPAEVIFPPSINPSKLRNAIIVGNY